MPPCKIADTESQSFNKTGPLYLVRVLNETNNVETTTVVVDDYDQVGAMQFIICTIFTYSFFGVFFMLLTRFRQGTTAHQNARTETDAINNYLKSERTLKLEGCKLKMISEIEKHAEDIKKYEEKLRLLEIQRNIRENNFGMPLDVKRKNSRLFKTGSKKQKKTGSMMAHGKRRLSLPAAFGRMGFSFLFMDSGEQTIKEESERFMDSGEQTIKEESERFMDSGEQTIKEESERFMDSGDQTIKEESERFMDSGEQTIKEESQRFMDSGEQTIKEESERFMDSSEHTIKEESARFMDSSEQTIKVESARFMDPREKTIKEESEQLIGIPIINDQPSISLPETFSHVETNRLTPEMTAEQIEYIDE